MRMQGMKLQKRRAERGFTLPLVLFMILVLSCITALIATMARENLVQVKTEEDSTTIYYASEGMLNKIAGDIMVYGPLWDQLIPISSKPSGYTEYSPSSYTSTNGIPPCAGVSCHRNYYPTGGGLVKNVGPLYAEGSTVSTAFTISDQLSYTSPPPADETMGNLKSWVQVERLDETTPSSETVGGNLSSSLAEGGNAKKVRFRITTYTFKKLRGRYGISSVVSVVEVALA